MITPQTHNNGTSKDELLEQAITTLRALRDAEEKLREMAPNARDYYHTGNLKEAQGEHLKHVIILDNLIAEVELWAGRLLDN